MQEKKKRNRILMLLIVGMLLIYAFTDIENVKISRGRNIFFGLVSQNVLKQAANWLLPGLTYVKEGRKDTLTGRIEKRDRKSTRLNSSHITPSRMPSSA